MKSHRLVVVGVVGAFILLVAIGMRYAPGLWPAFGPAAPRPPFGSPSSSVSPDTSGGVVPSGPLDAAPGWSVSLLADGIPGARDLLLEGPDVIWVSQTSEGKVTRYLYDPVAGLEKDIQLTGLDRPHGLAIRYGGAPDEKEIFIAEETRISTVVRPASPGGLPSLQKIADLPGGGRHFTRSLIFGPDGRLYVSIGSTCDVCDEKNPENGSVISMKPDGSDRRIVARGLRNAVFLTYRSDGTLWATEMGRDFLGDDLPPDEINVIVDGGDYGWPICYGGRVHDTSFDDRQYVRDPCADTEYPAIEIPAHSAPLGLAFLPDGDLLVAYHGSWNRSIPTGYKVVRFGEDPHGPGGAWKEYDVVTGFLRDGAAVGRPVDVMPMPDGSVLISDDKAGAIWRMVPSP